MKIENIKAGDILASTDAQGTGYFLVLKVNRVTIDVRHEGGVETRAYPVIFDRKVDYEIPAFTRSRQS